MLNGRSTSCSERSGENVEQRCLAPESFDASIQIGANKGFGPQVSALTYPLYHERASECLFFDFAFDDDGLQLST